MILARITCIFYQTLDFQKFGISVRNGYTIRKHYVEWGFAFSRQRCGQNVSVQYKFDLPFEIIVGDGSDYYGILSRIFHERNLIAAVQTVVIFQVIYAEKLVVSARDEHIAVQIDIHFIDHKILFPMVGIIGNIALKGSIVHRAIDRDGIPVI